MEYAPDFVHSPHSPSLSFRGQLPTVAITFALLLLCSCHTLGVSGVPCELEAHCPAGEVCLETGECGAGDGDGDGDGKGIPTEKLESEILNEIKKEYSSICSVERFKRNSIPIPVYKLNFTLMSEKDAILRNGVYVDERWFMQIKKRCDVLNVRDLTM